MLFWSINSTHFWESFVVAFVLALWLLLKQKEVLLALDKHRLGHSICGLFYDVDLGFEGSIALLLCIITWKAKLHCVCFWLNGRERPRRCFVASIGNRSVAGSQKTEAGRQTCLQCLLLGFVSFRQIWLSPLRRCIGDDGVFGEFLTEFFAPLFPVLEGGISSTGMARSFCVSLCFAIDLRVMTQA
jgi:hypothetical protein